MTHRHRRVWLICLIALTCFLQRGYGDTVPASQGAAPSIERLPAVIRAAKEHFCPLTDEHLRQARGQLEAAVARLEQHLDPAEEKGREWRVYLLWDQLASELSKDEPDLGTLDRVYKRLVDDREGLGMAWFLDVRDALARYRNTARNIDNAKLPGAYEQVLDALAAQVEAYSEKPTAKRALAIGYLVDQLEGAGQAPDVIRAVRHHFVKPNLKLVVSAEFVSAGLAGPIDRTGPVRDNILGTEVRGQGRTVGRTVVELVPDERFAVIDMLMEATNRSRNVGYNGPVRVFSDATTSLASRKRIWIDEKGVHSFPAVSDAKTNNRMRGLCAVRGGRLVERFARRRAAQQEPFAEAIAAEHAEQRLNRQIDDEAGETIPRMHRTFIEKFRRPLLDRRLFPRLLRFSTTADSFNVVVLAADDSQLAAPAPPPAPSQEGQIQVSLHESLVHNLADRALAGRTLTHERYVEFWTWLRGSPPQESPEEKNKKWAVSFPELRPVSVEFADGQLSVTIRGRRYYEDGESYPGMDVSVRYAVEPTPQGVHLVRQGEPAIFPPGFQPGGRARLTARQLVIRKLLEKRYQRIFKPKLLGEGIEMRGSWSEVGRLKPVSAAAEKGWLITAWRVEAHQPAPPGEAPK